MTGARIRLRSEIGDDGAGPDGEPVGQFALTLHQFIAAKSETPPALIGREDDNILPAHGLGLLVAKGGKGKTTLAIDMVLHLASGIDWLRFEVARPLRILFIENEGPREPFRRKLERKRESWLHEIQGAIFIYAESWGAARLDEAGFLERLRQFIDEHEIDLVVGDPLGSLGMDGEGSPSETRAMVDRLKAAGLFSTAAWWVLHHSRKEKVEDAIDVASGAWGGHPDAMLALEKEPGNRARLSFPKLRWGSRDGFAHILTYDPEHESFELITEDAVEDRDLVAEITEWLTLHPYSTAREIAAPKRPKDPNALPGIGANRETVASELEGHPDRFTKLDGEDAKAVGRHPSATVWKVARPPEPPDPPGGLSEHGERRWAGGSGSIEPPAPEPALPDLDGGSELAEPASLEQDEYSEPALGIDEDNAIFARRPGRCPYCWRAIKRGDLIVKVDGRWHHDNCEAAAEGPG